MKKFIAAVSVNFLVAAMILAANFTPRTAQPVENDPHFTSRNPFYWADFGMPNCTAYAWGRAYEILGRPPELNLGNARYWFYNDGGTPHPNDNFMRGQEPKLGAIAVWGAGAFGNAGHVAVVESINYDGTINISESGFGGPYFAFIRNVDVHANRSWMQPVSINFLGFIYLCTTVTPPIYIPAPPMPVHTPRPMPNPLDGLLFDLSPCPVFDPTYDCASYHLPYMPIPLTILAAMFEEAHEEAYEYLSAIVPQAPTTLPVQIINTIDEIRTRVMTGV